MSFPTEYFPLLAMIPLIIEDQLTEEKLGLAAAEAEIELGMTPASIRSASSNETFSY